MQTSNLETSDDMALTKQDQEWISLTIENSHRSHGWQRIGKNLREWSAPGIAVTLLIFFLVQWSAYIEFRTHTTDRLDKIDADVRLLRAPIEPRAVLDEMSRLNQKQFAYSLPALRKAQEQKVSDLQPQQMQAIAEKLRSTDPITPEYWPTVLQFLHFATAGISANVPPPGPPTVHVSNANWKNNHIFDQRVLLDGGSVTDSLIENSRVVFTEHPVKMNNVRFVNCVFDLPATDTPNRYLMDAAKDMLASPLNSVSFKNLS
jgi:hypothetical protein